MESYNIAEAKARFSELIDRAAEGEEIQISKRGEPRVRLVAVDRPKKPIDVEALRALTAKMKKSKIGGVEILREMRDRGY
ncbi:MAG: type II toxin-antitoxin system Phd/YefM family antitoxin [Sphingomonadaceae bacterium]